MSSSVSRLLCLLTAACVGVSLGAVLYYVAILRLDTTETQWFVNVAAAAGVLAWVVGRRAEGPWPAWPALAGLGVVTLAATLGLGFLLAPPLDHARLSARSLPGFSIDLPPGDVDQQTTDYRAGQLLLKHAARTGTLVDVRWEPGGKLSGDELQLAGRALDSALGGEGKGTTTTIAGPGATRVDTIVFDARDRKLFLSIVPCGERRIIIATAGSGGVDQLHGRIVASVACHPDANREAGVASVPLKLGLPATWMAAEHAAGSVELTDGNVAILVHAASVDGKDLEGGLRTILPLMGEGMTVAGPAQHGRVPLGGKIEGTAIVGWAQQFSCPQGASIVMVLAPDQPSLDGVEPLAKNFRCLEAGERAETWPDAPKQ